MVALHELGPEQVAVFETFVAPRLLRPFADAVLAVLVPSEGAALAHLGCRTGFPDRELASLIPGVEVKGADPSGPALELARTKSALIPDASFEYEQVEPFAFPWDDEAFSHAMSLYPFVRGAEQWQAVATEMARLLAPGGQALCAVPVRGSYPEWLDLLREFALKRDVSSVASLANDANHARPTIEQIGEYFEQAGFDYVDVDLSLVRIPFRSGRDFIDDPIMRIMVLPEMSYLLDREFDLTDALSYVRDAIDQYWSESEFALGVHVGCVTARKPF